MRGQRSAGREFRLQEGFGKLKVCLDLLEFGFDGAELGALLVIQAFGCSGENGVRADCGVNLFLPQGVDVLFHIEFLLVDFVSCARMGRAAAVSTDLDAWAPIAREASASEKSF